MNYVIFQAAATSCKLGTLKEERNPKEKLLK
jgi:hypothetical protein